MQNNKLMILMASAILIAGILVAGCTDSSSSGQVGSTSSQSTGYVQADETATAGDAGGIALSGTPGQSGTGDRPQFNRSAGPMGTPPDGMQGNGTRPSGTPPSGMQGNSTWPMGTPPSGTPPSGP